MAIGMLGAFLEIDSACTAIENLRKEKIGAITVFTPTPRHEFEHALHPPKTPIWKFTLTGALSGAVFGYWVSIWGSNYWPLIVGGKAISTWIPYTVFSFELMVLVGGLSTVAGVFVLGRIPRLTMTVGYDPRFSGSHYGVWVECPPEKLKQAEMILKQAGAQDVRGEA
jgi:hypothetical protein